MTGLFRENVHRTLTEHPPIYEPTRDAYGRDDTEMRLVCVCDAGDDREYLAHLADVLVSVLRDMRDEDLRSAVTVNGCVIPVRRDPDMEHEGHTDGDVTYDGRAFVKAIRLNVRDSDPQRVLLHEIIHAALITDPQRLVQPANKGHEDFVRMLTAALWDNGWRALVGDETPNQTEGEPDMTTLSPAALALDSHLMVAANPGGPRTVCACGEAFYSNVDFLNHVAQMVVDAAPRPAREQ